MSADVSEAVERLAKLLCTQRGYDPDEHVIGGQATGFEDFGPRWKAARNGHWHGFHDYEQDARDILAALQEGSGALPASPSGGQWRDRNDAPRNGDEFQVWWRGSWHPRARFDPETHAFQLWGRTDYDIEGWEVFPWADVAGWMPHPDAPSMGMEARESRNAPQPSPEPRDREEG